MNRIRYLFMCSVLLALYTVCYGQQKNDTIPSYIKGKEATGVRVLDTLPAGKHRAKAGKKHGSDAPYQVDSATRKKHDPRKATLYSTFCPGLGQIYNHKYWKLPLVYAAVGIPAYTFFYNKNWYNKCQYALVLIINGTTDVDSLNRADVRLRTFIDAGDDNPLRNARNEYRKDMDYSVLFFLVFWGLNIVDATVDAHLMNFDITNELSMRLQEGSGSSGGGPGYNPVSVPSAVSLVFDIHKARFKPMALP